MSILLSSQSRVLVHPDDLARSPDGHVGRHGPGREVLDPVRVTHEDQLVAGVLPGVEQRAVDDLVRGVVAAHRIDRDANATLSFGRSNGAEVHSSAGP